MDVFIVTTPQLGVNDELVRVIEWLSNDGSTVSVGDQLCVLETAKATFELEAEAGGYFLRLVDTGSEVKISQPIGLIGPDLEILQTEKDKYIAQEKSKFDYQNNSSGSVVATQKAKDLAQRLSIDLTKVLTEGIIREQDVVKYLEKNKPTKPKRDIEISWDLKRKPVVIYGAGRGGVTVKECLSLQNNYQVVCFIDDNIDTGTLCNLPIYHSSRVSEIIKKGVCNIACAIANGSVRLKIRKLCDSLGVDLINVIHPWVYISPTVKIGKGNFIKAGVIIETNTVIRDGCIIDNGAIIAHDNVIGDGCHLAPGVTIGSSTNIGDLSVIGIGAAVASGMRIGKSTIISVGSSVIKDVPDYAIVEGVPAKIVGKRKSI